MDIDYISVAVKCENDATQLLAETLSRRYMTKSDIIQQERDIEVAHKLLQCGAMLRTANSIPA